MLARRLDPEGEGGTRGGVPIRTLAPKGMDWGVLHRLEGNDVNEDTGPRRGWIVRSHIG